MSYLKLLSARQRTRRQPTLTPRQFTRRQKDWAARGICIECGKAEAGRHSYICINCEASVTIEDIRDDLAALRRKILNRSGD